jgi:hypothetical protein
MISGSVVAVCAGRTNSNATAVVIERTKFVAFSAGTCAGRHAAI